MYNDKILKSEERAILSLRSLYKQHGYLPFKMSKFEEYDLYVRNKDFLISDNVITFNDTNGRLLALKPDVTLSIIKNTVDESGCKQKVYYDENVYRVSSGTHQFKEILQTGIECIGDIDALDMLEVVSLAARSLSAISSDFVLNLSHVGIFVAVLDSVCDDEFFKKEATKLVSEKNSHELRWLCEKQGISSEKTELILSFASLYGDIQTVISRLDGICKSKKERGAFLEFKQLCSLICKTEFKDKIRIDFSVINNTAYYNGIVFKGFINGICESVLSGGRYDPLMRRMGRKSSAVGFAIYVDLLEALERDACGYDVDVLLLYSDKTSAAKVLSEKEAIIKSGKSVSLQKAIPEKLRYKELVDLSKEGK